MVLLTPGRKSFLGGLTMAFAVAALGPAGRAEATPQPAPAQPTDAARHAFTRLQAHVILDGESGKILECDQCHERREPASMTKLLAAMIGFDAVRAGKLNLTTHVPLASAREVEADGALTLHRHYGIPRGTDMTLDTVFKAMSVTSAADAAITLSRAVCGTDTCIAALMNEKLAVIFKDDPYPATLQNMHFTNAHGMPDRDQYVTAYGMARIMQYMVKNYPEGVHYFSLTKYTFDGRTFFGHDALLVDYNRKSLLSPVSCQMEAGKTGYFYRAGSNIVVSATCDGHRVIVTDMGEAHAATRNANAATMTDRGFDILEREHAPRTVSTPPHWPAILTPRPETEPEPDAGPDAAPQTTPLPPAPVKKDEKPAVPAPATTTPIPAHTPPAPALPVPVAPAPAASVPVRPAPVVPAPATSAPEPSGP